MNNLELHVGDRRDSRTDQRGLDRRIKIRGPESASGREPNAWPPTTKALETIRNALHSEILSVPENWRNDNLLEELSRYVGLPASCIQMYAGSDLALQTIAWAYLEPGMEVIIDGPTASNMRIHTDNYGIRVLMHFGTSPFETDPSGLLKMVTDNTRIVFVGNPNYPTGTVYTLADIEFLAERMPGVLVVVDESRALGHGYSVAELILKYENVLVVGSFSNVMGLTGMPFGYLLTAPCNFSMLNRFQIGKRPPAITQAAARAVLDDLEHVERRIELVRDNMSLLAVKLRSMGISVVTTESDFILIQTVDPDPVLEELARERITGVCLGQFEQLASFISLPVRDDRHSRRIITALERVPRGNFAISAPPHPVVTLHRGEENHEKRSIRMPRKKGKHRHPNDGASGSAGMDS
ncbi:MAG: histidinol-phosphate aminotransferase family protein [candidate division Zixibacteria bacterium]|nr:histidinol-phosphate aminotransferase family protein [candidate division Zixibacteria bacterium]